MNYQDHAQAVTAQLVEMIRTGSHSEWSMPWHTHGVAGLLNTRNAITGTRYRGSNSHHVVPFRQRQRPGNR